MSTSVHVVRVADERASLRYRPRALVVCVILAAITTLVSVLSIGFSAADRPIAPGDVIATVLGYGDGSYDYRLVLVGIGIGAMLTSLNSYLLTRSDLADAMTAQVWLTGSLNGRSWEYVPPLIVAMAVLVPFVIAYGRRLALLEMGDDAAKALGISVERTRFAILLAAVGLSAVATAAAGPIGFIALAAPQIARRLMRAPGVGLVSAGLMGALLLVASDFVAQRLVPSTQLPVGVVTGAVGGGYLAWLLSKGWRASRA